jgi:hypothetical protein
MDWLERWRTGEGRARITFPDTSAGKQLPEEQVSSKSQRVVALLASAPSLTVHPALADHRPKIIIKYTSRSRRPSKPGALRRMAMYTRLRKHMTWVQDGIYAAGGDHVPSTWAEFSDQTGIRAVLHLCPGRPAVFRGPPPECFLWLAIENEEQAAAEERLLAGRFISECLAKGMGVLLHSSLGRHRTRWAYVAYEIYAGLRLRSALRRAATRPWLAPYHTDEAAWGAFADLVASNSDQVSGPRRPT